MKSQPENPRIQNAPCIFYDNTCAICQRGEQLLGNMMRRRGFKLAPLSSALGRHASRDGVDEMKVITHDQRLIGGAEAFAYVSSFVWWARPLTWLWKFAPARPPLRALYRLIAANRHCADGLCRIRPKQAKWDFDSWF